MNERRKEIAPFFFSYSKHHFVYYIPKNTTYDLLLNDLSYLDLLKIKLLSKITPILGHLKPKRK